MPKKNQKQGKQPKASWTSLTRVSAPAGTTETRRCTLLTTAACGAGGAISVTAIGTSSVTGAAEWSSYSARWTEARVLAVRLRFVPRYPMGYFAAATGATAAANSQLFIGTDRSGAATITTANAILALEKSQIQPGNKVVMYEAQAIDLEDQLFSSIGTMANNFRVAYGVICSGAPAGATTIFDLFVEWMVQFRGAQ